jgi:N-acetylglucosamine kinase-like BadF-type ATPase
VAEFLARRFPDTEVRLAPDFAGVLLSAPDDFDVYCIAGTGSVCFSQAAGAVQVSGGRGYLLGDQGSAFRYGQALVAFALEVDETDLHPLVSQALVDVFGTVDRRSIVQIVHASPAPAPLLGRLAPTLTGCAEMGHAWAEQLVGEEAMAFARVAAHHVRRFHRGLETVRVGLAGGVWTSGAVVAMFTAAVARCLEPCVVAVHPLPAPPVVGAVELARLPLEEVRHLAY